MLDAVSKISILKPAVSAFSVVKSIQAPSKARVHPNVNYSQMHTPGSNNLTNADLPRINRGIKGIVNSLSRPQVMLEGSIKEDEEEHNDHAALLAGDLARDMVRKKNKNQANGKDIMSMTAPMNQPQ